MTSEMVIREEPTGVIATHAAPSALVEWAHAAVAAHELATSLCATQFCPDAFRAKPGEATAAILAGAEVGMSPLAALNAFDVIQGRPAPKAITLRALAQSHGHDIWLESASPQKVVMKGQRRGSTRIQTSEWTITRANGLGLTNKPNWKSQPQAMLTARATSEIARLVAADVILGIPYASEELFDMEPEPTTTAQRAPATRRASRAVPVVEAVPDVEPDLEPPAETGEAVTKPQLSKMHATFNDFGITDRDYRLGLTRALLNLDIGSANELTKTEASTLIDLLEQCAGKDNPSVTLHELAGMPVPEDATQ